MSEIDDEVSQLWVSAEIDDVSFPMIVGALSRLDEPPSGADDTERMLNFVSLLLDHGFVAVTSPYADPPSTPWPEQARGKAAILQRVRREWEALDHEVTFLDLCWFHRPRDGAAKAVTD